ncbi:FumA C-terminus/TtdB family hydratase beta subunit [Parasphaerochaeta coccoides]|uniref:Hydro-lyase, Fe-S type, tartrate/fumarate subfamily, beta subunit n=1 Tax=Parasphaerochaeta coccoides (strain ATCC BAA-1237 / DSM 17374 / SPN1) TaxID=760011 RepID=F4GI48_PARC1|nr:FumA C-terminus/TtdB family hydratase beta subunit [Parasphaerochaeta coccoides]AEC02646.1 hydro-lyase, Fe-S type, tartrate/fumarate subfamily, beta subunit [Parasphaerochaeta coccoides DSM 17374]
MHEAVRHLRLPLESREVAMGLKPFERILLDGTLYVARDQAHKRFVSILSSGGQLPIPLKGSFIYYMGPSPAPVGRVIGSCGPTTSARMDPFTPLLLEHGLSGMVGKGPRSREVHDALVRHGGLYLQAYGGCGALYASRVISSTVVACEDLGPEAVFRLEVRDFPVVVAITPEGGSVFGG